MSSAAVAPNGQTGKCGPYYIWYQTTPDTYPPLLDYIDLCGITFDISDVVNDFDFVYFTDTDKFQRAGLDKNQDGVSDWFFSGRTQNQLEWRVPGGCIRVSLQECQGASGFQEQCGYAMMSIQPKQGFRDGSARIAIGVNAKCPPNGIDCTRSYELVHAYRNCFVPELPEFILLKQVKQKLAQNTYKEDEVFEYDVIVRNTGEQENNNTILTDVMSNGTEGGKLRLGSFKIDCPQKAMCSLLSAVDNMFKVSLINIPPNKAATISYEMVSHKEEIPRDTMSYFTNTATLSTGSSDRVMVGVLGTSKELSTTEPEPRKERPFSGDPGYPYHPH